jgi:plastocyanin
MAKLGYLAVALSIFLVLSIIPGPLLGPIIPKILDARASTLPITLRGFANGGWNATTNANPTITVHAFDTIKLSLGSGDGIPHQFLLDGNKDGSGAADCPSPDPCSAVFPPSTIYTFSVSSIAAGTYTYYCVIHPTTMLGMFVIAPDFSINANPSTLSIPTGSFGTSQMTLNSNGFSGTVSLSSTVAPSTPTITTTLKPTSVTLNPGPGGSGTSTLNVTTTPFTPLGSYSVNVTGTSGGLSHSTQVTVTVTSGTIGGTARTNPQGLTLPIIGLATTIAIIIGLTGIYIRRARKKRIPQA